MCFIACSDIACTELGGHFDACAPTSTSARCHPDVFWFCKCLAAKWYTIYLVAWYMPYTVYTTLRNNICHTQKQYMRHTSGMQVLFSRHVGEVRQGHWFDPVKFDWPSQSDEVKYLLLNAGQKEKNYKKLATELLSKASFNISFKCD